MSDERLEYLSWVDQDGELHVRHLGGHEAPEPSPHEGLEFWRDRFEIGMRVDEEAALAALTLRAKGHVFWEFCPGDMTSYRLVFVHDLMLPDGIRPKLMAGVCGPLKGCVYEVGDGFLHPGYVGEKWLTGRYDGYTAHVLARFIEGVRDGLHGAR